MKGKTALIIGGLSVLGVIVGITMKLFSAGSSSVITINNKNELDVNPPIIEEKIQKDEIELDLSAKPITKLPEIVELPKVTEKLDQKKASEVFEIEINKLLTDWGFRSGRTHAVDTIIVHSSYDSIGTDAYSREGLIKIYKKYEVAPHYLIDRKGAIYQLVSEKNTAYHAGVAKLPNGDTNVNERSIGIELMSKETDKVTEAQYKALNNLLADFKSRYKIAYIKGHSDIAPERKTDPWGLDWSKVKK